jgi:putative transposase
MGVSFGGVSTAVSDYAARTIPLVFDRIASGRTLKCLAIVDDATHEAVAVMPEHTIGGDHLTRIMDGICSQRGKPSMIRTDNARSSPARRC